MDLQITCEMSPVAEHDATHVEPPFNPSLLDDDRHLEGIGGWLVLVAIGVVISPFVLLFSMFRTYVPLFANPRVWLVLQAKPGLHALVLFEAATNIISFLLCLALLYLFLARKRSFPTFMILYLGSHAIFLVSDLALLHLVAPQAHAIGGIAAPALRSVIGAAVWIPYMIVSRRVRVTFVR